MADRPTEARAYGAHNTAPPLSKLPVYAGVSLGWPYGPNLWSWPTGLIKPCHSLIRSDQIVNRENDWFALALWESQLFIAVEISLFVLYMQRGMVCVVTTRWH